MIPPVPVSLCPPYQGANLLTNTLVKCVFSHNIRPGIQLVAGGIVKAEGRRFLVVLGESRLGPVVEASVWEEEWEKLDMLLDSPQAMCHAARWLAERVGWPMQHIVTAPEWRRVQTDKGPEWVLSYGNYMLFVSDVPGISDITDPAEALAAACRAVGAA